MKCYGKSVNLLESVEVLGGGAGFEESSVEWDYFVWFGHLPDQRKMKAPISKVLIFLALVDSTSNL